jgi:hypothetical protein
VFLYQQDQEGILSIRTIPWTRSGNVWGLLEVILLVRGSLILRLFRAQQL